jgi:hypothetical protein
LGTPQAEVVTKIAVTVVFDVRLKVQVVLLLPVHCPFHWEKTEPLEAVAVRVIDVEAAKLKLQVGAQAIPAGELATVPFPVIATERVYIVGPLLVTFTQGAPRKPCTSRPEVPVPLKALQNDVTGAVAEAVTVIVVVTVPFAGGVSGVLVKLKVNPGSVELEATRLTAE